MFVENNWNLYICKLFFNYYSKYITMIIVPVKEGENIDRALKKFKRKFERTGVVRELRSRQAFTKPSVIAREQRMKAVYKQQMQIADEQ